MDSVMAAHENIKQTHVTDASGEDLQTEMKSQGEAEHADEEVQSSAGKFSMKALEDFHSPNDEIESEADQSDKSESESETPAVNETCASCKKCFKLLVLCKVLTTLPFLYALFASPSVLSTTKEAVEIASGVEPDKKCYTRQAAGSTAMCIAANACLPYTGGIADANSSSFALGMDSCTGHVEGIMQMPDESFAGDPGKLVANLSCDSGHYNNTESLWQNVSQDKAVSMDPELPINPFSHTTGILQQMKEESALLKKQQRSPVSSIGVSNPVWQNVSQESPKPSTQQSHPWWPSIGVGGFLLAVGIKLTVF